MKRIAQLLLGVLLVTVLLLGTTACSSDEGKLSIDVAKVAQTEEGTVITLEIENDYDNEISFGWGSPCKLRVMADGKSYTTTVRGTVDCGDTTLDVMVNGCQGEVEKITLTNLRLLGSNGLPAQEMTNVVIYDTEEDIDGFRGDFNAFSQFFKGVGETWEINPLMVILMVLGPCLFIGVGVLMIVLGVKQAKRNRQNAKVFQQYVAGAMQNGSPDMTTFINGQPVDSHQQMHQQAMDMHNQAVNLHNQAMNQQQFNQFTQQSGTTMDMGGFIPPPPPPPTGF